MPILDWIGKKQVINHDKELPFRLLKRVDALSVGTSENLIINGDNLEALKALMPYYYNKVQCIYIDPPYNTGEEKWVYNDNVNSPEIKKWLGKIVRKEGEDLSRHDKWLCMMYPRLKLLWELLRSDGIIFVSIDENEVSSLHMLLNDIFGRSNRIAEFVWQKRKGGGNDSRYIALDHEYVLVYAKDEAKLDKWRIKYEEDYLKRYNEIDDDGRYYWDTLSRPGLKNPIKYSIDCPDGTAIDGDWQISKRTFKKQKDSGDVRIIKVKKKWTVHHKVRMPLGKVIRSLLMDIATNSDAQKELLEIFGEKKKFSNPKPVNLIKRLISLISEEDSIILDSFAGSGTTAHAVLDLNKEGGNRKFILVEMEKKIVKQITAERVKRVIKGYTFKNKKGKKIKIKGLGGGFQFMNLDNELFDAHGLINDDVTYTDLARYIFFTETKLDLKEKLIKGYFIGDNYGTEYFLIYKKGKENVLNEKNIKKMKKTAKYKVVYADNCTLDADMLKDLNITFKQIPYELRGF